MDFYPTLLMVSWSRVLVLKRVCCTSQGLITFAVPSYSIPDTRTAVQLVKCRFQSKGCSCHLRKATRNTCADSRCSTSTCRLRSRPTCSSSRTEMSPCLTVDMLENQAATDRFIPVEVSLMTTFTSIVLGSLRLCTVLTDVKVKR